MKKLTREAFVARAVAAYEKKYGIPPGWWANRRDIRSPSGYRITSAGSMRRPRFVVSRLDGRGRRIFFGTFGTQRNAIAKVKQLDSMLARVTA